MDDDDGDFGDIPDVLRDDFEEVAKTYFTIPQNREQRNQEEPSSSIALNASCENIVVFEKSPCDLEETKTVELFMSKGCGCQLGVRKSNCSSMYSLEKVNEQRRICFELTAEQLDIVILAQLQTLFNMQDVDNKKRQRLSYMFEGRLVCLEMYMFLYGIGRTRLKNLKEHFFTSGITPRAHGHKGYLPPNTFPKSVNDDVVKFIENYAEDNAVYLPGRFPAHKSADVQLLPSSITKVKVWEVYKETTQQEGRQCVGLSTFKDIWNKFCPYVVVMKAMTDLCFQCQSNTATISRCANLTLREKLAVIQNQSDHLKHADTERDELRRAKRDSEKVVQREFPNGVEFGQRREPCSLTGTMHYSYDYAQQVHYPSNPMQPGPIYFKTPRKCGIFGIQCEAIPRQINYLIDESVATGKGANATISYVHHFLEEHGLGETDLHCHADNCSGQNKNNYFIWYYLWRTMTGLHKSVIYSFLIAGHTKFSPDWCFGLFKQHFRRTFVSSLFEIADVFHNSSVTGINVAELCGLHSGEVLVSTYDWASYLSRFFKKIVGLKKFHHFRFSCDKPGVVFCKEYVDSPEIEFSLLKNLNILPARNTLPEVISPAGLSAERRKYLMDEIRQFCKHGTQDLVAPLV